MRVAWMVLVLVLVTASYIIIVATVVVVVLIPWHLVHVATIEAIVTTLGIGVPGGRRVLAHVATRIVVWLRWHHTLTSNHSIWRWHVRWNEGLARPRVE